MYEIFVQLLQKTGARVSQVAAATGIPKSTFTDWKNGRSLPKIDKMQKLADYFDVSVDYLMTGKEPDVPEITEEALKVALFGGDGEVTDEMWEEAKAAVEFIKFKYRKDK